MQKKTSFQKDMRRVIARNYGEQVQLEKLRKYLDKSKTLEVNRFQRSQMDTILQLCGTRGVNLEELCNQELVGVEERKSRCETNNNSMPRERPQLTSSKVPRESKEILMLVRRFSQSIVSTTSCCSVTSRISAKSFLPEKQQILERKSQLERSRTWPQSHFWLKRESALLSAFPATCEEVTQKTTIEDGKSSSFTEGFCFKEDVVPEDDKTEKPLHELLPPVQLPSLRLRRTPILYKRKSAIETKKESTTDDVWKDLKHCRYLRPYLKHKP